LCAFLCFGFGFGLCGGVTVKGQTQDFCKFWELLCDRLGVKNY